MLDLALRAVESPASDKSGGELANLGKVCVMPPLDSMGDGQVIIGSTDVDLGPCGSKGRELVSVVSADLDSNEVEPKESNIGLWVIGSYTFVVPIEQGREP